MKMLFLVLCLANAAADELIDPHDMLGSRKLTKASLQLPGSSPLSPPRRLQEPMLPGRPSPNPFLVDACRKPDETDAIFMRRFVRMLLKKLSYEGEGQQTYELGLSMSRPHFDELQKFALPDSGASGIQEASAVLESIVVSVEHRSRYHATVKWLSDLNPYLTFATQVLLCIAAIICILVYTAKAWSRFHWRFIFLVLVALFIISIPWTWMHLYKSKLAERMMRSDMEKPKDCDPEKVSVFAFWSGSEQKCAKYYEDLVVDPLWEVKPTEAVAMTVVEFVWKPLEKMGKPLGTFFGGIMEHVPWFMRPFVVVIVLAIICFFMIVVAGYRIRITPLIVFEPSAPQQQQQQQQALPAADGSECSQETRDAIQHVREAVSRLLIQSAESQRRDTDIKRALDALSGAGGRPALEAAAAGRTCTERSDMSAAGDQKREVVATIGNVAAAKPLGTEADSAGGGCSAAGTAAAERIEQLDHLVLTVKDIDRTVDFYCKLGMRLELFKGSRKALHFGSQKINLHELGKEFEPKARCPMPGSADLCFVSGTQLLQTIKYLTNRGIKIEEGPVERTGARGPIMSVYMRDPDDNLVELAHYVPASQPKAAR